MTEITPYAKDFRDLKICKKSYSASLEIHKLSLNFPQIEQYALANQIRRASKSVCSNVGEGFSKQLQSKAEFRRFILMAIGSCGETMIWADYRKDLNYISYEKWQEWNQGYQEILKMLHSLRIKI